MTVCIAAICDGGIILGLSDRMITWGDIQFEPLAPKIFGLTSSISVMTSGDAALQREIMNAVTAEVAATVRTATTWLDVKEVAEMIVRHRNSVKLHRAAAALLGPLGLDEYKFLQGLHGLNPDLTRTIATDLIQFPVPHTSFIVSGVDDSGAHLFTVFDGVLSCNDAMGFAAIGIGARHAESQFMLGEHARSRSLAETLLLIYTAKKRAEVAPGVGAGTDGFTAGPAPGTLIVISDDVLQRVDAEYQRTVRQERRARATAKRRMEEYVDELRRAVPASQEADGDYLADDDADGGQPSSETDPQPIDAGA